MTALTKDPMLRRDAWCQCPSCEEYFCSVEHFDIHRVKRICTGERTSCLTGRELAHLMVKEGSGHWRLKRGQRSL